MKLSSEGLVESTCRQVGLLIMSSKLRSVNAFVKLSWPRLKETGDSSSGAIKFWGILVAFYRLN